MPDAFSVFPSTATATSSCDWSLTICSMDAVGSVASIVAEPTVYGSDVLTSCASMVTSVALMPSSVTPSTWPVTSSIDPASSCVRNGNPPSSTVGVPTTPSRFCSMASTTRCSATDSVTRSATNAPPTSTTTATTPTTTPRPLTGLTLGGDAPVPIRALLAPDPVVVAVQLRRVARVSAVHRRRARGPGLRAVLERARDGRCGATTAPRLDLPARAAGAAGATTAGASSTTASGGPPSPRAAARSGTSRARAPWRPARPASPTARTCTSRRPVAPRTRTGTPCSAAATSRCRRRPSACSAARRPPAG